MACFSGGGGPGSWDPVDRPPEHYYISFDNEMAKPLSTAVHSLKALAHPGRLRILAMLRGGELCVCQMTVVLDLAASSVSAHLADLKRAGLVGERRDGRWVFHRLEQGAAATALLEPVWSAIAHDPQVEADARLLRELRRVGVEELCRVDLDLKRLGIKRPPVAEAVAR
jgi:DNA-binding transcriptional ArsR family regulator